MRLNLSTNVNVKQVCAGSMHTALLLQDGTVWTFGLDDDGALGQGQDTNATDDADSFTPRQVHQLPPCIQISAGASHTAALSIDNEVFIWGTYRDPSGNKQLTSSDVSRNIPTLVMHSLNESVAQIASGEHHTIMLTDTGRVFEWGFGGSSMKNTSSSSTPQLIEFNPPPESDTKESKIEESKIKSRSPAKDVQIISIYGGGGLSGAIDMQGRAWTWGPNNYSQAGFPYTPNQQNWGYISKPAFLRDVFPSAVAKMALSTHHALFLVNGSVYSTGRGHGGRLGHGTEDACSKPTKINMFDKSEVRIIDIAVGEEHSMAVTAGGDLYCWGENEFAQTGNPLASGCFYAHFMYCCGFCYCRYQDNKTCFGAVTRGKKT